MRQLLNKSLEVLLSLKEWKYIDQFFLIPITMWTTIESAFFTAQFTRVRPSRIIDLRFSSNSADHLGFYHLSGWNSVRFGNAARLFS